MVRPHALNGTSEGFERLVIGNLCSRLDLDDQPRRQKAERTASRENINASIRTLLEGRNDVTLRAQNLGYQFLKLDAVKGARDLPFNFISGKPLVISICTDLAGFLDKLSWLRRMVRVVTRVLPDLYDYLQPLQGIVPADLADSHRCPKAVK